MSRPRGFKDYQPRLKARILIDATRSVLDEYSDHLPLTLRQVFYQLVVKGIVGKTEKEYDRLCETLNRARRGRWVPFDAIRDDGFTQQNNDAFADLDAVSDYLEEFAAGVVIDRQRGQDERLQVWCEAAGMVPQLVRVAEKYGIPVMSSGGFDSVTTKHDIAMELAKRQTTVLHIGDHDPSGVHIFSSLAEDIRAFVFGGFFMRHLKTVGLEEHYISAPPEFVRLAVTPDQIDHYKLPTAPPKPTDRRSFSGETAQAEALPPSTLAEILDEAITSRLDMDLWNEALTYEQSVRDELTARIGDVS